MKNSLLGIAVSGILAVVGIGLLVWWTSADWSDSLGIRVPGMDNAPPKDTGGALLEVVLGEPVVGEGVASNVPGAWPWFRGANLDAICDDGVALDHDWTSDGPEEIWSIELGEGYAAAAVDDGRVYVLDHLADDEVEQLRGLRQPERETLADALKSVADGESDRDALATTIAGLFSVSSEEQEALATAVDELLAESGTKFVDALRYEMPLKPLRNRTATQRAELADGLDTLPPGSFDGGEAVLRKTFPIKGVDAAGGSGAVSQSAFDLLSAAMKGLCEQRRPELIAALRFDPAAGQPPPGLFRPSLDDVDRSADVMRCLSLDDGREIWSNRYRIIVTRNHAMSRTVPAVVGKYIVSLGPRCHVVCWDAETGRGYWVVDLAQRFGTEVPQWYAGQCPLIDPETKQLILAPAGTTLMAAIDMSVDYAAAGNEEPKVIWETPSPDSETWKMTHASVTPMDFGGRRAYVYAAEGGVAGVSADDGTILWQTAEWQMDYATTPAPVILDGGRILLCSGYRSASVILQVSESGGQFSVEVARELTRQQFGTEQQTPVLYGGYLYGVRKIDKRLVCLDQQGTEVWNSDDDKFGQWGYGPLMIADGLILVMDDHGRLSMVEATSETYRPRGSAQVIDDAHETWGPMALVGGRLIVRDVTQMVCLDLTP